MEGLQTNDGFQTNLRAVERLLSNLSHELKNPLSIVRGNAQLAMMTNKEEKVGVCLRRIVDAVDSMTSKLDEIRCLRRPMENTMEWLNLGLIVRQVFDEISPLAQQTGVDCACSVEGNIKVKGNCQMLIKAFYHIMRNAIEAMPAGGALSVRMKTRPGWADVFIADTGSGIPPELRPLVFKQFFSTKTGGCGWGLVIADQVVRGSHGGSVQYTCEDAGTVFTVTLPTV